MHFNKAYFFAILTILSGCISMSKEEQTQNILSSPSFNTSTENSLEESFFATGDFPKTNWWESFESQELNSLIEGALSLNPSIQQVKSTIDFARQKTTIAKSRLFPLIFFDGNETWEFLSHNGLYRALNPKIPITNNLVNLSLSFNYEVDFWGKYRNLFRAALGEQKASQAEYAQAVLITTTSVAQTFFALKTNLVRERLYKKLFSVRSQVFELQNLLQEEALLSKLPPLLSKENVSEAEQWVFAIQEEIAENKHLLNTLVGIGPDEPLAIDSKLPPLVKTLLIPENISLDLLSRRPDLMAQIWRVEAIAHEVGAAKADFFPNVNLMGFLGLESGMYAHLLQKNSGTGGLAPAFHLPIFTAGAIRANVRAKKATFDEAVYSYNTLLLQSAKEVTDVLSFAKMIFLQKKAQDSIVQDAKMRYEITELRNQKGLDSRLANYAFLEELIQKRLKLVSLIYNQYVAAIKLIKALGGGYASEYTLPLQAKEVTP